MSKLFLKMNKLNITTVKREDNIKTILEKLNTSKQKIIFCVTKESKLVGTITDGDIRRAILNNDMNQLTANLVCNKNPLICNKKNINQIIKKAKLKKIQYVPLVEKNKIISLIRTEDYSFNNFPSVVLMAGGLGTRLGSLTKERPKPLIELSNNVAIIDIILTKLIQFGLRELHISLNYEWKQIKNYLTEKYSDILNINFVIEKKKMGTAGSLFYLKEKLDEDFIVMNADILTALDFSALYRFHKKNKSSITVVANKTSYEISKGVIEHEGYVINTIKEKPKQQYIYNAGIYVINKACLDSIEEKYLDMPDLIKEFIPSKKVMMFPLYEYWKDLGIPQDLEDAKKDFINGFN